MRYELMAANGTLGLIFNSLWDHSDRGSHTTWQLKGGSEQGLRMWGFMERDSFDLSYSCAVFARGRRVKVDLMAAESLSSLELVAFLLVPRGASFRLLYFAWEICAVTVYEIVEEVMELFFVGERASSEQLKLITKILQPFSR
jgi:hypothetical protein